VNCKGQECEYAAERDGYCRFCWAKHQAGKIKRKGELWIDVYRRFKEQIESELGPVEICQKCHQKPVEYDAPGFWCRCCWAAWWADGMFDNPDRTSREWRQVYDGILDNNLKTYGKPDKFPKKD
jgi:hypothetical protein